MLEEVLKKVGFNKKETRVYLALLELGSQPASVIGKKAGINRSTTYLILDGLIAKGFVNQYVRADVKYFTAADPQVIAQTLEHEENRLHESKETLIERLPDFYALTNPLSVKPKVRFYEGEEGVKQAMEDTLTATETLLSWDSMDSWLNSTPGLQKFIREYGMRRVAKKVPVNVIALDTPTAKKYLLNEYPPMQGGIISQKGTLLKVKWAPKDTLYFNNEINIYDNKVSIISLGQNELFGIIMESKEIAQIHRSIFEMSWNLLK
jgi:HTH-type transcriptional regulator, sugar sensing transcriptional regulator